MIRVIVLVFILLAKPGLAEYIVPSTDFATAEEGVESPFESVGATLELAGSCDLGTATEFKDPPSPQPE